LRPSREFSDSDWVQLGKLTRLRSLDLTLARIDNRGLREISGLTQLRYLNLSHNPAIGDDGLKYLEPMTQLEELIFDHNAITAEGLDHLKPLARLKRLYVWTTGCIRRGRGEAPSGTTRL
jgi:hypothetical protein